MTARTRICVVTAGHLATCPRMLKAADAFAGAGYKVRMVSTKHMAWAVEADQDIRRTRATSWKWNVVDYRRDHAPKTYFWSGLRFREAQFLAKVVGPAHCSLSLA